MGLHTHTHPSLHTHTHMHTYMHTHTATGPMGLHTPIPSLITHTHTATGSMGLHTHIPHPSLHTHTATGSMGLYTHTHPILHCAHSFWINECKMDQKKASGAGIAWLHPRPQRPPFLPATYTQLHNCHTHTCRATHQSIWQGPVEMLWKWRLLIPS